MKYVSTRGGMAPATFSDIILSGLAPDGGLVVPERIPLVDAALLEQWRSYDYAQLATEIIGLYATDIPRDDLEAMCRSTYSASVFGSEAVVPLTPLDDALTLVGLSEGPTLAFKDIAMQFLGRVLPYELQRTEQVLNVLGATSGDTGSAAEHALRAAPGIAVFMLSPRGRMSEVQRRQMYTLTDANIHNIAIDGVFDDCQNLVKSISADGEFKSAHSLGTVNSINFGRICAQIVYYFWAWLRYTDGLAQGERDGFAVSFAVPSGNFGNIYSGELARRMGLPIRRLVLATNENNVLDEFFRSGIYTPRDRAKTLATSSPSMDISKASNLERFIYDLLGADSTELAERWRQLDASGRLDLSELRETFDAEFGIVSGTSTHANRLEAIRAIEAESGIIVDPHTADGITVARRYVEPGVPMLVLETAKPAKFPETVFEAIGRVAPLPPRLAQLAALPLHAIEMDDDATALRAYIDEHAVR